MVTHKRTSRNGRGFKFEIDGQKRNAHKFGTIDLIEVTSDNSLISNSRSTPMLQGVTAVWFLIVVLRGISVLMSSNDRHEIQGRRQQAADFYAAMIRTICVAPAVAFLLVLRAQTPSGLDGLEVVLQAQLAWILLNVVILAFWAYMSKRKGGKWGC